jgi:hypothetical protein
MMILLFCSAGYALRGRRRKRAVKWDCDVGDDVVAIRGKILMLRVVVNFVVGVFSSLLLF